MSLAKCACNGCVYWPRIDDPTQVTDGTSYWQCAACRALSHDPSDQRTPVLLPNMLTAAPKWQGKVPRITSIRAGAGSAFWSGRVHGREDRCRPWTKVWRLRMYTIQTQDRGSDEPAGNGACWAS
jgi:hypothetical protein